MFLLQSLLEAREFSMEDKKDVKEIIGLMKKLKKTDIYEITLDTKDPAKAEKVAKSKGYTVYPNSDQFSTVTMLKKFFASAFLHNLLHGVFWSSMGLGAMKNEDGVKSYFIILQSGTRTKGKIFLGFKGDKVCLIYKEDDDFKILD